MFSESQGNRRGIVNGLVLFSEQENHQEEEARVSGRDRVLDKLLRSAIPGSLAALSLSRSSALGETAAGDGVGSNAR